MWTQAHFSRPMRGNVFVERSRTPGRLHLVTHGTVEVVSSRKSRSGVGGEAELVPFGLSFAEKLPIWPRHWRRGGEHHRGLKD